MLSPIPYSALIDRPPLRWPDNARVAFWVQVNLESFELDRPNIALSTTRGDQPIPCATLLERFCRNRQRFSMGRSPKIV